MKNKFSLIKKLVFILAILTIGIYFRLYPISRNPYKKSYNLSRLTLYSNLKKSLINSISKNYPGLSPDEKDKLLKSRINQILSEEKDNFNKTADKFTEKNLVLFKPYLLGSDSFYYYDLTKRLLDKGEYSSLFKDGSFLDPLMMAPNGHWRKIDFHPYSGLILYKIISLPDKNFTLMQACALVPMLLYIISAGIFILLCLNLKISKIPLFIGSVFFSLSPIFIQRSAAGWYDSDPYNVIFPLASILFLIKTLNSRSPIKWLIALILTNSIYSLFWQGWLFLPITTAFFLVCIILLNLLFKQKILRPAIHLASFLTATTLLSMIFLTPGGFMNSLKDFLNIIGGFKILSVNLWPDIFLTVGELKNPSLWKIINIMGGIVFFFFSLVGVFICIFKKTETPLKKSYIILSAYWILCFILIRNVERFSLFFLPPCAICFTIGISALFIFLRNKILKILKGKKLISFLATSAILSLLLISPFVYGQAVSSNQHPIFNKVWEKALTRIKDETPKESIVTSWWCPGHFIKAIAERKVTFDGATLNEPQAYWVANILLAEDEKKALGLLRMINTSGNKATEYLLSKDIPIDIAVKLIIQITAEDKESANKLLKGFLNSEDCEYLLSLTHGPTGPSYIMIYNELAESALGLHYVKNWDFSKILAVKQNPQIIKKKSTFSRGSKDNISLMWAISGGPVYIGNEMAPAFEKDGKIYYSNAIILNTEKMELSPETKGTSVVKSLHSILFYENGKLIEKNLSNPQGNLSVLFLKRNSSYSAIIAPAEILKSILFRMHYLGGKGLKYFEKVIEEEEAILNTKITVFKVNE